MPPLCATANRLSPQLRAASHLACRHCNPTDPPVKPSKQNKTQRVLRLRQTMYFHSSSHWLNSQKREEGADDAGGRVQDGGKGANQQIPSIVFQLFVLRTPPPELVQTMGIICQFCSKTLLIEYNFSFWPVGTSEVGTEFLTVICAWPVAPYCQSHNSNCRFLYSISTNTLQ